MKSAKCAKDDFDQPNPLRFLMHYRLVFYLILAETTMPSPAVNQTIVLFCNLFHIIEYVVSTVKPGVIQPFFGKVFQFLEVPPYACCEQEMFVTPD